MRSRKVKYTWKQYWRPTPKLIRKIADSLLVGAMTISTATYFSNNEKAAFIILLISSILKMISNFFGEENNFIVPEAPLTPNNSDAPPENVPL